MARDTRRASAPFGCWAVVCRWAIHATVTLRFRSLRNRKKQLIAVGIVNLEHVVLPPGFLAENRALDDFTTKICQPFRGQLDEQARLVSAPGVFAEDDLAFSAIDLADFARAVACMPVLFEAEQVDVETKCAVHVGDEEYRARVPAVNNLISHGLLCHCQILIAQRRS